MKYYKDCDNEIWELSDDCSILYRRYNNKINKWTHFFGTNISFRNSKERWKLKQIDETDVFIELI